MSQRQHRVALLPGDGIGLEVAAATVAVIDRLGQRHGFRIAWEEYPWGCEFYLETGAMMPADAISKLAEHDAILLGAVGSPQVADHVSLWGMLIPIRREFDQYVNLRPVRSLPGVPTHVRSASSIDMVIVRENTEGEYSEIGGRLFRGSEREMAVQEAVFTRAGIERIARFASKVARDRGRSMVGATKSNGIIHTMPFWDDVITDVARAEGITLDLQHIDALAARFVTHPGSLDVVVASNLFGDILSDLGSAVAGGIGLGPSANLNPERRHPSMFESIHGSAPDIAGKGIANPVGEMWAGALMLEHLGEANASNELISAFERVLGEPETRTRDLGGPASTEEFTEAVLSAIG